MEHCRLAGLPDLDQDNSFVSSYLLNWINSTIFKYGFDGIRFDTLPEVKKPFWQDFNRAAGVFAVGEVNNGDVDLVSPYQGQALDSVLSYPLFFHATPGIFSLRGPNHNSEQQAGLFGKVCGHNYPWSVFG